MAAEQKLPRAIEEAVYSVEQRSATIGEAARQICRKLLDPVIFPNSDFGNTYAIEWLRQGISETSVVNLAHVNRMALSLPSHEYDLRTGEVIGKQEEVELKELAKEATGKLRKIAADFDIGSPGLLVDAILALTDSLNSLEEQV